MLLTGILECNQIIYSYLESQDLWNLRSVSKNTKDEVNMELSRRNELIGNLWDISIQTTIVGTQPDGLHSNGKRLHIIGPTVNHLWKVDLPISLHPQLLKLKTVGDWGRISWSEKAIAIVNSVYPKTMPGDYSYTTTICDTESGEGLAQLEEASLIPTVWHHQKLLMNTCITYLSSEAADVFIWDILNDPAAQPLKIYSFEEDVISQIKSCQSKEELYCFKQGCNQPFLKLNLESQQISPLSYRVAEYVRKPLKNFNVTPRGNIFFSSDRSIALLSGEDCKVIANIPLPISPVNIAYQFPLMACYENNQLCVYDIRKSNRPMYHQHPNMYNQITNLWKDDISNRIKSIAFHNGFLCVGRQNDGIDVLNLSASESFDLSANSSSQSTLSNAAKWIGSFLNNK